MQAPKPPRRAEAPRQDSSLPKPAPAGVPLIVLMDIDGTMIGRIGIQACEYELLSDPRIASRPKSAMKADLIERLRHGIMRPYLRWLVKTLEKHRPDVELFVYTASDDGWAAFLVPCIEEVLGRRFNRPLFTRKHCAFADGEYKKSLDTVVPTIFRKLRAKYPELARAGPAASHVSRLRDNTLLVDNNPTVLLHPARDARRLVRCPTYAFAYVYDVLGRLDLAALHGKFRQLVPYLEHFDLFPSDVRADEVKTFHHFTWMYYRKLYENAKAAWRDAQHYEETLEQRGYTDAHGRDTMWRRFGEVLRAKSPGAESVDALVKDLNVAIRGASARVDARLLAAPGSFAPQQYPVHKHKARDNKKPRNRAAKPKPKPKPQADPLRPLPRPYYEQRR